VLPVKDVFYPKNLKLEKPDFAIMLARNKIMIRANTYAKYVQLSFQENDAVFSDNYFDLLPGVTKTITYKNADDRKKILSKLKVRSLFDIFYK